MHRIEQNVNVGPGHPISAPSPSANPNTTLINHLTSVPDPGEDPGGYELAQNYPNPFNPSTTIRFAIRKPSHVELNIYDALGRLVRSLVDEDLSSGGCEVVWNGKNGSGVPVASGVYVCRIKANSFVASQKMICIR